MWHLTLPEPEVFLSISRAAAVQAMVRHGAEINEKPKLVFCIKVCCVHIAFRVLAEVPVDLILRFSGLEALAVHFVWQPVDGDLHAGDVGVEKIFGVPCSSGVSLAEEHEDSLNGPVGDVDAFVDDQIPALWDRNLSLSCLRGPE